MPCVASFGLRDLAGLDSLSALPRPTPGVSHGSAALRRGLVMVLPLGILGRILQEWMRFLGLGGGLPYVGQQHVLQIPMRLAIAHLSPDGSVGREVTNQ